MELMAGRKQCEFFLLRYMPSAVRQEFVNFGVVLLAEGAADVRFTRDWRRVQCLDAAADLDLLQALEDDLRSKLRSARDRESLLELMRSSFSGAIELSPSQACLAESPQEEVEKLAQMYLEVPLRRAAREAAGRAAIVKTMREAFEHAGVWELMRKRIAVAQYTRSGDPLRIDCGYRPNGVVKMFHAVSLATEVDSAKVLAFSFPQIAEGIRREEKARAELTAIVEDGLDRKEESIAFAFATLKDSSIIVATTAQMPRLADAAARELRI